jgi:hypothetical protein
MNNFAPRALIVLAWGIEGYQVTGGPSWMKGARYDIEAKAEGNPTVQQMEGFHCENRFRNKGHVLWFSPSALFTGFSATSCRPEMARK